MLFYYIYYIVFAGRKAVQHFKNQFGVDFSRVDDFVLLAGTATCCDGAVSLVTHIIDPKAFFRVISFSTMQSSTKMNNTISQAGWILIFNEGYQSTGKVKKLIPARSSSVYANMIFRTGINAESKRGWKKTKPDFPGPIFNYIITSDPVLYQSPFSGAVEINCFAFNEHLGVGKIRGIFLPDVNDPSDITEDTIWHGREVITFPSTIPFTILDTYVAG